MHRPGRWLLALTVFGAACFVGAEQSPRVLIVQEREEIKDDVDRNIYVLDYLAQELESSGLLAPVLWSMTDPVFRTASLDGTLARVPPKPSPQDAIEAAGRMKAGYVVWIHAVRAGGSVKGNLKLYRNGKEIYKNEQNVGISIGNEQSDVYSGRTLARTWMLLLATKALKDLKAMPKVETPPISPGQQPPVVTPPPVSTEPVAPREKGPVDNTALRQEVSSILAGGRRNEALARLRDAVDQEPLDLDRRTMLIEALTPQSAQGAAEEARRASLLFPQNSELRILAARAWMRAGKPDEARQDLNEAVARDPEGVSTRLMLAEINLGENEAARALEHIDAAIKAEPSAEAFYDRALCRALLGGAEGLEKDLQESKRLEPEPSPDTVLRRYDLSVQVLRRAMKQATDDQRSLLQRAMVRPKDAAVLEETERLQRQARSRVSFLGAIPVPVSDRAPYERRLLAARLLEQSLVDLQLFLGSGNEDALTDSRINLGEAARHLAGADEKPK